MKKNVIIFLGFKFLNYFVGVTKGDIFFFGGGGGGGRVRTLTCSKYRLCYFFVHNSFKKKDGSTVTSHI